MCGGEKKSPRASPPSNPLMGWAHQGIESLVAAQKIVLDLAALKNALVFGMVQDQVGTPIFCPGAMLSGLADKGVKNFTPTRENPAGVRASRRNRRWWWMA